MGQTKKEDVELFLCRFHEKMKVFGILFRDDRDKNQKTLEALEITPVFRRVVIENLTPQDYVEGPLIDTLYQRGEMWVFGKDIKGRDVYIKITMGMANSQTICISFHLAEHPLTYPFKEAADL